MKKLILIAILAMQFCSQAQEIPSPPANGFAFPIGSKFTIKLYPVDSTHFDFSVIAYEAFDQTISLHENDSLFKTDGEAGTIDFYFCFATDGDTEKERDENMHVVLLFKNRTIYAMNYTSEIQRKEDGKFESTSNVGTYPGVKTNEMWPYMIYQIGLFDFRRME